MAFSLDSGAIPALSWDNSRGWGRKENMGKKEEKRIGRAQAVLLGRNRSGEGKPGKN